MYLNILDRRIEISFLRRNYCKLQSRHHNMKIDAYWQLVFFLIIIVVELRRALRLTTYTVIELLL